MKYYVIEWAMNADHKRYHHIVGIFDNWENACLFKSAYRGQTNAMVKVVNVDFVMQEFFADPKYAF